MMLTAAQARKDLTSNLKADEEQLKKDATKQNDIQRKALERALKLDVPKLVAKLETEIYEAVAARKSDIKHSAPASTITSAVFDSVKFELEAHGYTVTKEYDSGTMDWSDEVRNVPYADYILYITW
jgi:hypothetical protein